MCLHRDSLSHFTHRCQDCFRRIAVDDVPGRNITMVTGSRLLLRHPPTGRQRALVGIRDASEGRAVGNERDEWQGSGQRSDAGLLAAQL